MSQWDPNDPNNPYNQQQGQQQWGQQQGHQQQGQQQWGQQGQQQQWDQQAQQGQQQWDQQAQQQGQQQWDQGQQQQWDQQAQQQGQQQWDQGQQQQQWGQQPQQQWDQGQQQQAQHQQAQQQTWGQQGQQWGGQQPAAQAAGYGAGAYQDAYNETFGNASDSAPGAVATLGVNERVAFLRKTYIHLFGAIAAFAALEFMFLWSKSPLFELVTVPITDAVFGGSRYVWLAFLGAFVAVGYVAERWAESDAGQGKQYMGLGLYVLAEAIIFIPLLFAANMYQQHFSPGFNIIAVSGIVTMAVFAGLTLTVFITKKDFSFMRGALTIGAMAAMGLIVASIVFGFNLGLVFSAAMLLLAGGYVLYYTSKVLHYYRPGQHVAAALALFSAVALMFWYVVRIVMELTSR